MTRNLLIIAFSIFLVTACGPQKPVDGFYSKGYDYDGPLKPRILTTYPAEIDSIVNAELLKVYGKQKKRRISVCHSLVIKSDDAAYIDTMYYQVQVSVKGEKKFYWSAMIDRDFKLLGFSKESY